MSKQESRIVKSCDLHALAHSGDESGLRHLLLNNSCRGLINSLNRGKTPLLCATFAKPEIVRLLLTHGADVRVKTSTGLSALHLAVAAKNVDSVRMILDAGVDVNLRNSKDVSALYYAVNCPDAGKMLPIVKLLLERGADPYEKNKNCDIFRIPASAVRIENEAMVELILDYMPNLKIKKDKSGINWPLVGAVVITDKPSLASRFIERGADVNQAMDNSTNGLSVLQLAVTKGRLNQAKLFVEKGANVNVLFDEDGDSHLKGLTLVHLAVVHKTENSIHLLKFFADECGLDLAARDKVGRTALHLAAVSGVDDVELLEFLLGQGGLRLDDQDDDGNQALHFAALSRNAETCVFLLKRGAEVNARSKRGLSPLFCAVQVKQVPVIEALLEHGAEITEGIFLHTDMLKRETNGCEVQDVLLRHLAKLECLGLPINKNVRKVIRENRNMMANFEAYVPEMKRMRETKIYGVISLLDIAIQGKTVISGYARNEQLVSGFEEKCSETKFPRLYKLVADRFNKEVQKQRTLRSATTGLSEILPFNIDINWKIVSYMREDDLKHFIKGHVE